MIKEKKPKRGFADGYKTYDTSNGFGSSKEWRNNFYEKISDKEAVKILHDQEDTPHQILGIADTAGKMEIKTAFRAMIIKWHPDKNQDNIEEAEYMSKRIIAAYTILSK
ncbi:MAG: J domain-containing protein [Ferruginibacter sp.]